MNDRSTIVGATSGTVRPAAACALPLMPCPHWCDRPARHDWSDGVCEPLRCHWHTVPVAGTAGGNLLLVVTDSLSGGEGVQRSAVNYVVTPGGEDGALTVDGMRGLAVAVATALALTDQPPLEKGDSAGLSRCGGTEIREDPAGRDMSGGVKLKGQHKW
ncbi:hypothetical protein [Nocardia sp. NPDC051570]|uniref:hypothetical protein n=1 Tax=Nocardia sp. NPDC051570 TaxID=3364324 RepID=UPI0037B9CC0D